MSVLDPAASPLHRNRSVTRTKLAEPTRPASPYNHRARMPARLPSCTAPCVHEVTDGSPGPDSEPHGSAPAPRSCRRRRRAKSLGAGDLMHAMMMRMDEFPTLERVVSGSGVTVKTVRVASAGMRPTTVVGTGKRRASAVSVFLNVVQKLEAEKLSAALKTVRDATLHRCISVYQAVMLLQVLGHCSEFAQQEIALFIFSRINDLTKFWDAVLPLIPPTDQRAVMHRLGILNVFNPSA